MAAPCTETGSVTAEAYAPILPYRTCLWEDDPEDEVVGVGVIVYVIVHSHWNLRRLSKVMEGFILWSPNSAQGRWDF